MNGNQLGQTDMDYIPPSKAEKLGGGLPAQAAFTLVAAGAGGMLSPLLAPLANCLAAKRFQERVDRMLQELQKDIESIGVDLQNLSDGQFQVVNGLVAAAMQTVQEEKFEYLRMAMRNALADSIPADEGLLLTRILRDITAGEIAFLVRSFKYDTLALFENTKDEKPDEGACYIDPKSSEASLLGGLYALGVVYPGEQTFGFTKLHFAPHAAKLIALLKT